jgi:hypothetical protein
VDPFVSSKESSGADDAVLGLSVSLFGGSGGLTFCIVDGGMEEEEAESGWRFIGYY